MKKPLLLIALLALSLSGCGVFHHDRDHGGYPPRNKEVISDGVSVSGGSIKLEKEFVFVAFDPSGKPVTVEWKLDPKEGYRFTQRGIVIEGRLLDQVVRGKVPAVALDTGQQEIGACKPADEARTVFSCVVKPVRTGVYKYSIQLTDGKNEISLDPPIFIWK
jgi:hypothetical protein